MIISILPYIIEQTDDYTIVFKPPRMHSIKNKQKNGSTLAEWYEENVLKKSERKNEELPENGLMHRLDFETHGLVLFAKNRKSYAFFKDLQDKGELIKEYSAVSFGTSYAPRIIMSYFRPYGPGRKEVRPVTEIKKYRKAAKDKGGFYRTEITCVQETGKGNIFTVRIKRGFRHQIRCHLSWIGCPILNDPLYAQDKTGLTNEPMALRAHALFFTDPQAGENRECRIESISQ